MASNSDSGKSTLTPQTRSEETYADTERQLPGSPISTPVEAKAGVMDHVEQVHTNERVPGHANYYEKDGLRTQGDGVDHDAEPKMSFARMMSLVAMAFCMYLSPQHWVL